MSTLIWIPARAGSQRVARKNLRLVGSASLVARTIWFARRFVRETAVDARIVVDTDDSEIRAEAILWGAEVPFLREARFAGPAVGSADTALRCLDRLAESGGLFDSLVVLQPTSPLREMSHIISCWRAFTEGR